jgi:lantibiotic modifying enzyme
MTNILYFMMAKGSFPYYLFTKFKAHTYPSFFYKILTQSLIKYLKNKNKKMKENKRKKNIYIKIIYSGLFVIF